jgi:response regulator RpfG family c-di-GMP phosphodiesterase
MTQDKNPALLVVDDEGEILYSLRGLLRKEYDFHAAQSGYEGLKVLERVPIQVVMADQRMPEMTGVDFLAQVRDRYPDTTRLLLTGYADLKTVIDAINHGHVFHYITKPWDPDGLRLVLRQACARHDRLAEGRRLLADVNAYLGQCLDLLNGLRHGNTEADRLAQAGTALRQRVDQALTSAPDPAAGP